MECLYCTVAASVKQVRFLVCSWYLAYNIDSDSVIITIVCWHLFFNIHTTWCLMRLQTYIWVVVHQGAWSLAVSTVWLGRARHWEPERRRKRVRQAPTHTPAPYMLPIHSYLVPVTRWLQNGIDYWFPSYHRSVVMAGFSGLTESLMWDNKRREEGHEEENNTHKHMSTNTYS